MYEETGARIEASEIAALPPSRKPHGVAASLLIRPLLQEIQIRWTRRLAAIPRGLPGPQMNSGRRTEREGCGVFYVEELKDSKLTFLRHANLEVPTCTTQVKKPVSGNLDLRRKVGTQLDWEVK